jgi:hypothetical protein
VLDVSGGAAVFVWVQGKIPLEEDANALEAATLICPDQFLRAPFLPQFVSRRPDLAEHDLRHLLLQSSVCSPARKDQGSCQLHSILVAPSFDMMSGAIRRIDHGSLHTTINTLALDNQKLLRWIKGMTDPVSAPWACLR